MAHLFVESAGSWDVLELVKDGYHCKGGVWAPDTSGASPEAPSLVRCADGDDPRGEEWVLLDDPGHAMVINGLTLGTGFRVLRDRDEIRYESWRGYFSRERLPQVELFDGRETKTCPRCQLAIVPQQDRAVTCDDCGVVYHRNPDRACYDHAPCAICQAPTELRDAYRWTPEQL